MKLSRFLETDYVAYASYDNLRKIANYVDGQKLASRKVLYTILKKNINKDKKVSHISSDVSAFTSYLHGEVSLEGVIKNMAMSWVGSNNLPLLVPEGNFGTRFIPEPGASRYVYTKMQPYLRNIFKPEDDDLLEQEFFENEYIEYKYFVPIIPLILINGSEGISSGYAQKILPRKYKDVVEAIKKLLNNEEVNEIKPGFRGFKGEIKKSDNGWEIFGNFERTGRVTITITELPIGYNLKSYLKVLDNLEDKKVIKSYKDLSEDDNFKFEVTTSLDFMKKTDDEIIKILKLSKKVSENFTIITEEKKVDVLDNEIELLKRFVNLRLKYYTMRKQNLINKIEEELEFLNDRIKFINLIINNEIVINKKSKPEIIKQAENHKIKFIDEHLKMQLWNLTEEKINELQDKIETKIKELENIKKTTEKQMWLNDLDELNEKLPMELK